MEIIIKCSAAAIMSAVCSMLIKKTNPELASVLSLAVVCVIITACIKLMTEIKSIVDSASILLGHSDIEILPFIKCLAIGGITRLTADICRDSAQSSAASALELAGTVCAAAVSAPVIISMLKLIGGML